MFGLLKHVVVSIGAFFLTLGTTAFPIASKITPVPTPTPAPVISVVGSYSANGYTVDLRLNLPKKGGKITGQASGICNGPVDHGTYDALSGKINANISATCVIYSAQAVLDGNFKDGKGYVDATVTANGENEKGRVDLSLLH